MPPKPFKVGDCLVIYYTWGSTYVGRVGFSHFSPHKVPTVYLAPWYDLAAQPRINTKVVEERCRRGWDFSIGHDTLHTITVISEEQYRALVTIATGNATWAL